MKYMLEPVDEFSVLNHPLQQYMLKTHIVAASVMLFGLGMLTTVHILPYIRAGMRKGRRTGIISYYISFAMVLSGYLVQCFSSEPLLWLTKAIHIATSLVFCLAFTWHQGIVRVENRLTLGFVLATIALVTFALVQ